MDILPEVSLCDDLVQYAVGLETLSESRLLLVDGVCFRDEEERAGGACPGSRGTQHPILTASWVCLITDDSRIFKRDMTSLYRLGKRVDSK